VPAPREASVERLERENLRLKRTIGKKRFSHPMSCCFHPIFWMTGEASTLDELLRSCQRFDVQWIRFALNLQALHLSLIVSLTFIYRFPNSEKQIKGKIPSQFKKYKHTRKNHYSIVNFISIYTFGCIRPTSRVF
jgi:hypothetical protein